MNWVAFQIASGRVFFVALALLFLAAVVAPAAAPRLRRWATWFLLLGLGTVAVAATPLPIWAAALLLVPVAVPMVAERSGRQAAWLAAAAAAGIVAVGLQEARYRLVPVLSASPARRVAVIGDSLTAGNGENDGTTKWPAILRRRHGVDVQDFSSIGATAAAAAKRLERTPIDAPVVIVEIGGNDLLGGRSPGDFELGLDALLTRVCRPGRQVVMFELPLPPFYERFGRVQRALAARHGAHLVPKRILLSVIAAADATVDSIHLTQQGHERMADLTWAIVGPALPAGLHRP